MSRRPFYHSMVLDGHPLHPYQAQTLLFCLERFGRRQAALVNRYAGHGGAILQDERRKSASSRQVTR